MILAARMGIAKKVVYRLDKTQFHDLTINPKRNRFPPPENPIRMATGRNPAQCGKQPAIPRFRRPTVVNHQWLVPVFRRRLLRLVSLFHPIVVNMLVMFLQLRVEARGYPGEVPHRWPARRNVGA